METFAEWVQFSVSALVVLLLLTIAALLLTLLLKRRSRSRDKEALQVKRLSDEWNSHRKALLAELLTPSEKKAHRKTEEQAEKAKKAQPSSERPRVFVIDFEGDIAASANRSLRRLVTAILQVARPGDEVIARLESPGGMVHSYGLAASQLLRLREAQIPLTVAVDKVAASGGYMMACVAHRIVAAPFAIIGSIGAVSAMMNFHRVLKKHEVDYVELTAGEHKRTLTPFGELTEKGKAKHQEQLELIHKLFKDHVSRFRPGVDMEKVATGDFWPATVAQDMGLVDSIETSDDLIIRTAKSADVLLLSFEEEKNWRTKLAKQFFSLVPSAWERKLPRWEM